ncbi:MAG: hypothetical protein NW217_16650 [Hyphomicrobiaceae bacterium]|nr:hypothetical protein [Hyphomicrobiaceae bacterium]
MTLDSLKIPPCVYLVADHLDAALAAGEDLVQMGQSWVPGDAADPGVAGARRFALCRIRFHEMSLLTRIVQGTEQIRTLAAADPMFRPLAQLFLATTRDLASGYRLSPSVNDQQFDTGDGVIAYLRSRGLIDDEAPGLPADGAIVLSDSFKVGGLVPLGVVLDLVAEFLEALEAHYELYPSVELAATGGSAHGSGATQLTTPSTLGPLIAQRANDAA